MNRLLDRQIFFTSRISGRALHQLRVSGKDPGYLQRAQKNLHYSARPIATRCGVRVRCSRCWLAAPGSLDRVCTRERILKIFRIAGLTKVFCIHETVDQATATRKGCREGKVNLPGVSWRLN